jgi:xanthine dehydrogenase accessory factor
MIPIKGRQNRLQDSHPSQLNQLVIGIKGAGEMASAVAWRLYMANMRNIFMMEVSQPMAVRREVSFCEALYDGRKTVEGVASQKADSAEHIQQAWRSSQIAVLVDPQWATLKKLRPDVSVDAILAKKNLGTTMKEAPLVIGLGPGFTAASDVHLVIETARGHNLAKIISSGSASPNTGIPGNISGYTTERVLRAPAVGIFQTDRKIGEKIKAGDVIGNVEGVEVRAEIDGVLRGLIRSGIQVTQGLKLGDIDARSEPGYCFTISDKSRAIAGAVLEAILRVYNI